MTINNRDKQYSTLTNNRKLRNPVLKSYDQK